MSDDLLQIAYDASVVREETQWSGVDGVDLAKRWLESTTWIELPFNSYTTAAFCTPTLLDGSVKGFDLFGYILTEPKRTPLYVEVKNYSSVGGKQQAEYDAFLANAYSISAQFFKSTGDARSEFMFITTHPFGMTRWAKSLEPSTIERALSEQPEKLGGNEVDVDLLRTVADRIWLLVLHHKQERLMLTAGELSTLEAQLCRKERSK